MSWWMLLLPVCGALGVAYLDERSTRRKAEDQTALARESRHVTVEGLQREHAAIVDGLHLRYLSDMVTKDREHAMQLRETIAESRLAFETVVRMATTGSPTAIEPRVETPEPTAHEVLSRAVSEQTIERGMDELRQMYRKMGVAIDENDLREEVEGIVAGVGVSVGGLSPRIEVAVTPEAQA